ncbi:hypothetical protein RK21_00406 [Pseudomonas plecoglossicida]|nr:hypothetical protein RK21_00406 [Pseudomonas plecoglossicida]KAF4561837.1 hypothetical protein HBJ16_000543 [Pseudomonas sp. CES]
MTPDKFDIDPGRFAAFAARPLPQNQRWSEEQHLTCGSGHAREGLQGSPPLRIP